MCYSFFKKDIYFSFLFPFDCPLELVLINYPLLCCLGRERSSFTLMLDGVDSRKENIAYYDLVCKIFHSLHSSPQNYRAERKL